MTETAPPPLRCAVCDAVLLVPEDAPPSGSQIASATAAHYAEQHGGPSVPTQRGATG